MVAIAAGAYHSLALKADGTVVGWGENGYGQTTIPAGATNVVAIAAGDYHSLALKADGTVVGWGDNSYRPDQHSRQCDQRGGDCGGRLAQSGAQGRRHGRRLGRQRRPARPTIPASATNVVAIAAGGYGDIEVPQGFGHSLALRADGTVIGWGPTTTARPAFPPV